MKRITAYLFFFLAVLSAFAQNNLLDKSHYHDTYIPDAIVHKKNGIVLYEKWNMMLGSDTVRNDRNGYAANGFVEDYYTTGQMLHKGFYVDGQLKVYKNYFPNGTVERNFRMVDSDKSKVDIFYEDGSPKSKRQYVRSKTLKREDFYPDGASKLYEQYDKSLTYYISTMSYYENGSPETSIDLEDKKKLIFLQSYFYTDGAIRSQGYLQFNKTDSTYKKIEVWMEFDREQVATKRIVYENGKVKSETDL